MILEGAHFLELLLHPTASLKCEFQGLRKLFLGDLTMREEYLHKTGHGLSDSLAIAGIKVAAQRKVSIDNLCEIVLPHLTKRFCEIVNHKPVVFGEQFVPHLRNLPAW